MPGNGRISAENELDVVRATAARVLDGAVARAGTMKDDGPRREPGAEACPQDSANEVDVLVGEVMLPHDRANAVGPAAGGLEIGFDLHAMNVCECKSAARYRRHFPAIKPRLPPVEIFLGACGETVFSRRVQSLKTAIGLTNTTQIEGDLSQSEQSMVQAADPSARSNRFHEPVLHAPPEQL